MFIFFFDEIRNKKRSAIVPYISKIYIVHRLPRSQIEEKNEDNRWNCVHHLCSLGKNNLRRNQIQKNSLHLFHIFSDSWLREVLHRVRIHVQQTLLEKGVHRFPIVWQKRCKYIN